MNQKMTYRTANRQNYKIKYSSDLTCHTMYNDKGEIVFETFLNAANVQWLKDVISVWRDLDFKQYKLDSDGMLFCENGDLVTVQLILDMVHHPYYSDKYDEYRHRYFFELIMDLAKYTFLPKKLYVVESCMYVPDDRDDIIEIAFSTKPL